MSALDRLKAFERCYEFTFIDRIDVGNKIYIGKNESLTCRFCERDESRTTFSDIAHAIPEAIGNRRVILTEECDECNQLFSQSIEDSFDKYTKPFRIMSGIKGKRSVPSYKTRDKLARVDVDRFKKIVKIDGQHPNIFTSNTITNEHEIKLERDPYVPLNVYKAMLKMALSLLPNEKKIDFAVHFNWLMSRGDTNFFKPYPILIEEICFGPSFGMGSLAALLIRKDSASIENPYALFVLVFGSFMLQISIPKSNESISNIPVFPVPADEDTREYGCTRSIKNLGDQNLVKGEQMVFGLAQKT